MKRFLDVNEYIKFLDHNKRKKGTYAKVYEY